MENISRIEEYYQSPRISNSFLSAVQNPRLLDLKRKYPEQFELEDTTSLRVGAALDCLLTSPDRWEQDFKVINVNKPYGLMGKFVGALPAGITEESLSDSYSDAYWKSGYKMPLDWVIKKFWSTAEAVEYYVHTRNIAKGVTVLSKDEYDMVLKAKELVVASPFAAKYFQSLTTFTELRHQVPIYFTYKELECKALLDGIEINHREKLIQPFDLKTTGKNVYNFAESYITYGYYRQAAFYEQALLSDESPVKDLLLEGYELKDFIFIVAETKMSSTNPALIFVTTKQERRAGIHGGFTKDGIYHKGIEQLMWDYLWHITNDEWTYPKDVYNSEGRITLDVFSTK